MAVSLRVFNTPPFHSSSYQFALTSRDQKINRIQALKDVLWSKHNFCRTISRATHGDVDWQYFTFPCWVMPEGFNALSKYAAKHSPEQTQWIVKPRSSGAGQGIYVVDTDSNDSVGALRQLRHTKHVVQTYLTNPHLINGRKWDMRTYVLCTSVSPLRAYIYSRGLVRFATSKYDPSAKDGGKKTAFLTNTSVNKKVAGAALTNITWPFHELKRHFEEAEGATWDDVMQDIQEVIGLTLLSAESAFVKRFASLNGRGAGKKHYTCENCYQLLGVDIIMDANRKPRVIEVNGEPNMHLSADASRKRGKKSTNHYDVTKRSMSRDLVNIVYNGHSVASTVATNLLGIASRQSGAVGIPKCVNSSGDLCLHEKDFEYLLDMHRERQRMGGFLPVYPHNDLNYQYGEYLDFLRRGELRRGNSRQSSHLDGRRHKFHKLLSAQYA